MTVVQYFLPLQCRFNPLRFVDIRLCTALLKSYHMAWLWISTTPNDIVPEVFWFLQMQFCKPKLCCQVVFRETRASPDDPSKQATVMNI